VERGREETTGRYRSCRLEKPKKNAAGGRILGDESRMV